MSWIEQLYDTYEQCFGKVPETASPLLPISHTSQQAHVEVTLDGEGRWRSARVLSPREETVVPATDASAGRTSGEAAHALADKIQYCGGDYVKFGGKKPGYFAGYLRQLREWCSSPHAHPKARAVLAYVERETLVADLLRDKILHARDGVLLTTWDGPGEAPAIFRELTPKKENNVKVQDQGDVFVRWRVEIPGQPDSSTWKDASLHQAWIAFNATKKNRGFCQVSGVETTLPEQHPAKLRHGGDKAKLISSNDTSGYTFRGRFETAAQACSVGYETTQKAHNALRWLLKHKRTVHNGEQAILAWETTNKDIPAPCQNTDQLLYGGLQPAPSTQEEDAGRLFAQRLKTKIQGYSAELGDTARIVVMVLDAATTGRMAISYYRELKGSEFLARIDTWHSRFAWPQNFGKAHQFVGAPSPQDIAGAAFGQKMVDQDKKRKLLKSTIERLIPCIIDGMALPVDLLGLTLQRAASPQSMPPWEWQKVLGIACALYKGTHPEENYAMSLELDRRSRDYLYGRLLAVAEQIESYALYLGRESRDTNAAKLMTRFANRPYTTWLQLEIALAPYKSRIRAHNPKRAFVFDGLLQDIMDSFVGDDFRNDGKLSGEFLLAYHCQNKAMRPPGKDIGPESSSPEVASPEQNT